MTATMAAAPPQELHRKARKARARQLRRHRDRVVRLLHLRHGRGAGTRAPVFPNSSDLAGTLASFATLAVGFIARPIGGVVMGHFGDRVGRKSMLVISLLLMGFATVGIGVLPNYDAIGVFAPILLVTLRFVQGLGVGGEWGGAVLVATENAPEGARASTVRPRRSASRGCPRREPRLPAADRLHERRDLQGVGLANPVPAQRRPRAGRDVDPARPRGEQRVQGDQGPGAAEQAADHGGPHQALEDGAAGRGTFIATNGIAYAYMVYVLKYGRPNSASARPRCCSC